MFLSCFLCCFLGNFLSCLLCGFLCCFLSSGFSGFLFVGGLLGGGLLCDFLCLWLGGFLGSLGFDNLDFLLLFYSGDWGFDDFSGWFLGTFFFSWFNWFWDRCLDWGFFDSSSMRSSFHFEIISTFGLIYAKY